MASSIVIPATVAAQAAAISSIVNSRKDEACKELLSSFKSNGASVAEMREYSACVEKIYPEDSGGGSVVAAASYGLLVILVIVFLLFKILDI